MAAAVVWWSAGRRRAPIARGSRASEQASQPCFVIRRVKRADRKARFEGASQAPGRFPALHSLFMREPKKGQADPPPSNNKGADACLRWFEAVQLMQ